MPSRLKRVPRGFPPFSGMYFYEIPPEMADEIRAILESNKPEKEDPWWVGPAYLRDRFS